MAGDGLVDLSLFATSPADDRHFAVLRETPPERNYRSQSELSFPPSWRAAMKPLPAVPTRRLCKRSAIRGQHDANSRCILERIKRIRVADHAGVASPTIQQRRSATTTPPLTLNVSASRLDATATPQVTLSGPPLVTRDGRDSRPTLIWMPNEQMWLVQSERPQDINHYFWVLRSSPNQPAIRYARSEPSPDSNTHLDLSPLSPVRSQFLSLIETSDQGRLTPLFQEAVQTVPLTDISSVAMPEFVPASDVSVAMPAFVPASDFSVSRPPLPSPPASDRKTAEASWPDDSSEYESYHTASSFRMTRSSSHDEPRIVFPQLAWQSSWEVADLTDEGEDRMLVSTPPRQLHSDARPEREGRMMPVSHPWTHQSEGYPPEDSILVSPLWTHQRGDYSSEGSMLVSPSWVHQSEYYPPEDSMPVTPPEAWKSPSRRSLPAPSDESAGVSSSTPISPPSIVSPQWGKS